MNRYRKYKKNSNPLFTPLMILIIYMIVLLSIRIINQRVFAKTNEEISNNKWLTDVNMLNEEINNAENQLVEENTIETKEEENTTTEKEPKTSTYTIDGEDYTVIGILNIPSLKIEYPILSSTSDELLKVSLNKYWGANPNEIGNMVVVGHNYRNTQFFSKLPNINIGDIVEITDMGGRTLKYKVYYTDVIDPYDNSCTSQLTDGNVEITLITCYNNGTQRFVAKARAM